MDTDPVAAVVAFESQALHTVDSVASAYCPMAQGVHADASAVE
jgi:hypothetical protein